MGEAELDERQSLGDVVTFAGRFFPKWVSVNARQ